MKKIMLNEEIKNIVLSNLIESVASNKAREMNLQYKGYGRYQGEDGIIYKSDGVNLIPMDSKSERKSTAQSFLQKFVKHCNQNAKTHKNSKRLMDVMLRLLIKTKNNAHKEYLENILNKCAPYFNDYVIKALSNKNFRISLTKKFLELANNDVDTETKETPDAQDKEELKPDQSTVPDKPNISSIA